MAQELTLLVNTFAIILFFGTISVYVAKKFNLPKMIPLIITGIIISFLSPENLIDFTDQSTKETALIIAEVGLLLVLYQEGMHLSIRRLRENLLPIFILAVVGTIFTATLTGINIFVVANALTPGQRPFLFLGSLLMASIVVPTDPAATFSILRSSGSKVKGHLEAILGGESAFNDVIAILMVIVIILPQVESGNESLVLSPIFILIAIWQLVGGILVGTVVSAITLYTISKINADDENAALTLGSVFFIFTLGPILNISTAIAALTAGVVLANPHYIKMKRKYTDAYMRPFWDKIIFFIEIFAFTFVGFLFNPSNFLVYIPVSLVLTGIVILTRIISVYITTVPMDMNLRTKNILSHQDRFFIAFAGFKGLTTAVLALLSYVALSGVENPTTASQQFANLILYGSLFLILISGTIQGLLLPDISRRMGVYDQTHDAEGQEIESSFDYLELAATEEEQEV